MRKLYEALKKFLSSKKILYIIFGIYLIFSLILVLTHETWTDEAQAWLIAKDLSVLEIFKQMKYECHSCLWHLLLVPFAKSGLPIITMNIFSWLLVSAAVYLTLFHSKWNILVKIAVCFSPTYIYYLPVISRCYSMIPLILTIFFLIYPKRHERPILYANILGLLAHTHIVMCGLVGIAGILFICEYIRSWKKINKKEFWNVSLILFVYFILLAIQVLPAINNCAFSSSGFSIEGFYRLVIFAAYYFFPWIYLIYDYYFIVIFVIIFIILLLLFKYKKKLSLVFFITISVYFIIHFFWPFVLAERVSIIFLIIACINLKNSDKKMQFVLLILSVFTSITQFESVVHDYKDNFSDSILAATYINENIRDNSLIVFINSDRHVSMIPYVEKDVDFYNLKLDTYQTYITWNGKHFAPINYKNTLKKLKEFDKKYTDIYIVKAESYNSTKSDVKAVLEKLNYNNQLIPVFESEKDYLTIEWFTIYKFIDFN